MEMARVQNILRPDWNGHFNVQTMLTVLTIADVRMGAEILMIRPRRWFNLRYVFDVKEVCNDKRSATNLNRSSRSCARWMFRSRGPRHDGSDPADRCERGDLLLLASGVQVPKTPSHVM
jgi:hypothetical protein